MIVFDRRIQGNDDSNLSTCSLQFLEISQRNEKLYRLRKTSGFWMKHGDQDTGSLASREQNAALGGIENAQIGMIGAVSESL